MKKGRKRCHRRPSARHAQTKALRYESHPWLRAWYQTNPGKEPSQMEAAGAAIMAMFKEHYPEKRGTA